MAKCKRSAARALAWLVSEGAEVVAVVASEPDELTRDEQRVDLVASRCGLPLVAEEDLYREPPAEVDLVVSFLFWNRIREPLLSLGRVGCLNFHPAPLPDIRGVGGYNVERVPIDPDAQTAFSLDLQSQERLYELFKRVMRPALAGEELPREPQGEGRYVDREEFEALRRVRPGDDLERKLRAFWYPPYPGAVVELDGRELTLVDERLLREAAQAYRDAGHVP
jgi:methionyl-tRNA formyltransferase